MASSRAPYGGTAVTTPCLTWVVTLERIESQGDRAGSQEGQQVTEEASGRRAEDPMTSERVSGERE